MSSTKKVEEMYRTAESKMKEGNWKEGRDIALKCAKEDPNFLGGWKLMFMYEVRNATLENTELKEDVKDIPFKLIASQVTETKVKSFRTAFLKYMKEQNKD